MAKTYMGLVFKASEKQVPWADIHAINQEVYDRLEKLDPEAWETAMEKLEEIAYKITEPEAKEIVRTMRPAGEHWNAEQISEYIKTKGIYDDGVEWYLVMNMAYNDFHRTAKKIGHEEDAEFYFDIAYDFINDPDGDNRKVEKYFCFD